MLIGLSPGLVAGIPSDCSGQSPDDGGRGIEVGLTGWREASAPVRPEPGPREDRASSRGLRQRGPTESTGPARELIGPLVREGIVRQQGARETPGRSWSELRGEPTVGLLVTPEVREHPGALLEERGSQGLLSGVALADPEPDDRVRDQLALRRSLDGDHED